MSEQADNQDTERNSSEEPAEGAVAPGRPGPEREHSQQPAEGADPEESEQG